MTTEFETASVFATGRAIMASMSYNRTGIIIASQYNNIASQCLFNPQWIDALVPMANESEVWYVGRNIIADDIYVINAWAKQPAGIHDMSMLWHDPEVQEALERRGIFGSDAVRDTVLSASNKR
jgi:hypothetical protein